MKPTYSCLGRLLYFFSIISLHASQKSANRQGVFRDPISNLDCNDQVEKLNVETSKKNGLLLKHILHIGSPESQIKVTSNLGGSQFQQWDSAEDGESMTGWDLDFKALDKLYQSDGDFSVMDIDLEPEARQLRKAILTLAKLAGHAYNSLPEEPWKDLGPGWKVEEGFGWNKKRIRGYVFTDDLSENLIISFKGTTLPFVPGSGSGPTGPSDKESDNLMFSCCCGSTSVSWSPVCSCNTEGNKCNSTCLHDHSIANTTYYHGALAIYNKVVEKYPNSKIVLVGHSLGGSLASLVGITNKVPAFTFEAPGDRLYARRLGLDLDYAHKQKPFIFHFGNNADPLFLGTCNGVLSLCYLAGYGMDSKCHTFNKCVFDVKGQLGWSETLLHHRISQVITDVLEGWADGSNGLKMECWKKSNCTDCSDWEFV